jgi:hypothetical protein
LNINKGNWFWGSQSHLSYYPTIWALSITGKDWAYNPWGIDCKCRDWVMDEAGGQHFSIIAVRDGLVPGVIPVSEPETILLFSVGLLGIFLLRFANKRNAPQS